MKTWKYYLVAILIVFFAFYCLYLDLTILFVGSLIVSSLLLGSTHMSNLIQLKNKNQSTRNTNIYLAVFGVLFAISSNTGVVIVDLIASFGFGTCFGLIGVAFIEEKF